MEIENIMLPHIAVLMATYNGEKYLSQQLDSILAQKGVRVSLYIRDDRSTDSTAAILEQYKKEAAGIYLLDSLTVQLYAAKNFMSLVRDVDFSDTDYIAYSDQDDIWLPDKLIAAISAIKEKRVDCYASNLIMGDEAAKPVIQSSLLKRGLSYMFNYKTDAQQPYDYYFEAASAGCTLVLNKTAALYLQKVVADLFDRIPVNASHDWSTYAITRLNGFSWYIDKRSYIIYRQHAENAYGANQGLKGVEKLIQLFRSGWYRKHIIMIDELYNRNGYHPPFINAVKNYRQSSIISRFRMAFAISHFRRKRIHRVMLFLLIVFGYCK